MTREELIEKSYYMRQFYLNKNTQTVNTDGEYYFDKNNVEIGHVIFPKSKFETVKIFENGREWWPGHFENMATYQLKGSVYERFK